MAKLGERLGVGILVRVSNGRRGKLREYINIMFPSMQKLTEGRCCRKQVDATPSLAREPNGVGVHNWVGGEDIDKEPSRGALKKRVDCLAFDDGLAVADELSGGGRGIEGGENEEKVSGYFHECNNCMI